MFVGFLTLFVFTNRKRKYFLLSFILASLCLILTPIIKNTIVDVLPQEDKSINSWEIRKDYIWPKAWEAFLSSPIYGAGLGNDYTVTSPVKTHQGYHVYSTHNDYLTILVETGMIGLILYIWLIISIFKTMLVNIKYLGNRTHKSLCLAGISILTSFLTGGFFEHLLQSPAIGAYAFTIIAMAHGVIYNRNNMELIET